SPPPPTLQSHPPPPSLPPPPPRRSSDLASVRSAAGVIASPLCSSMPRAASAFVPSRRATTGTLTPTFLTAVITPSAIRKVGVRRSEEHTSELQSLTNLVCRLLLEKKINN